MVAIPVVATGEVPGSDERDWLLARRRGAGRARLARGGSPPLSVGEAGEGPLLFGAPRIISGYAVIGLPFGGSHRAPPPCPVRAILATLATIFIIEYEQYQWPGADHSAFFFFLREAPSWRSGRAGTPGGG